LADIPKPKDSKKKQLKITNSIKLTFNEISFMNEERTKEKFCIDQDSVNMRLDVFLANNLSQYSRTFLKNLIQGGSVLVNKQKIKPHYHLKTNDIVEVEIVLKPESMLAPEDIPLDIIFEDEDIIVLNKPRGLVVHPGAGNKKSTLANALLYHIKILSDVNPGRPGIVHRLDKETSGLLVIAKNNFAHLDLAKQFKNHTIKRRYIALVEGKVQFKEGLIDAPIKRHPLKRKKMTIDFSSLAKQAKTFYRVIKRFDNFTLLELIPSTGRTHQLRVHLAYLGHPILGDACYGHKNTFDRLALHAKDLGFAHPKSKKSVEFTSPLPYEIKNAIGDISL